MVKIVSIWSKDFATHGNAFQEHGCVDEIWICIWISAGIWKFEIPFISLS